MGTLVFFRMGKDTGRSDLMMSLPVGWHQVAARPIDPHRTDLSRSWPGPSMISRNRGFERLSYGKRLDPDDPAGVASA